MRALPPLPATSTASLTQWSNFHRTIVNRPIGAYLTPGVGLPADMTRERALSRSLDAILTHCFADPPERLCTIGSRWSLSNILDPGDLILDPGVWNQIVAVAPAFFSDAYRAGAAADGGVPVIAQGGATIRAINNLLGSYKLALQVSGASDGHRIAGCIATGTHGSHLKIGAVHDTVLAIYLVTGPNHARLIQPSARHFSADLARWFQDSTALATDDIADDASFNAARVALGGLGFVHSVIVEAVPLYQWRGQTIARPLFDEDVWHAIETLDTSKLDRTPSPDYFSVVLSPYAQGAGHGCYATLLWKEPATQAYTGAPPVQASTSTDLSRLLSALIPIFDVGGIAAALIGDIIATETASQYQPGPILPEFPGTYFGPTALPEGNGRSTEITVDHVNARVALRVIVDTLRTESGAGRHFLGGIGVRFSPRTSALLGQNIHSMNTYIELPSLGSKETSAVHNAVWSALRANDIPFACHWGQEYGMDASSLQTYYGDRVARWKAVRAQLLDTPQARAVFTNPLLRALELDQVP